MIPRHFPRARLPRLVLTLILILYLVGLTSLSAQDFGGVSATAGAPAAGMAGDAAPGAGSPGDNPGPEGALADGPDALNTGLAPSERQPADAVPVEPGLPESPRAPAPAEAEGDLPDPDAGARAGLAGREPGTADGGGKSAAGNAMKTGSEQRTGAAEQPAGAPLFGYDVFRRMPVAPRGPADAQMRPDYVVGQGDEFDCYVWGREETRFVARINVGGEVVIPRLGPVAVGGLTFADMKRALEDALGSKFSDFRLTVVPRRQRRMRIYVLGEAARPGVYDLGGAATAYEALFAAGGPTPRGTMRRIVLQRNDKLLATIDLYDFLLFGKRSTDVPLQEGDVIHIPLVGQRVTVQGKVKRPAVYELKPGEQDLRTVLQMAGEVLPTGDVKRIRIQRVEPHEGRVVLNANVGRTPVAGSQARAEGRDQDVVTVFPVSPRERQEVYLQGHVFEPGPRPWRPGMKLSDLLPEPKMLQRDPYFEYGEIRRETGIGGRIEMLSFNPGKVLAREPAADLALQPKDRVRILARAEINETAWVEAAGEVVRPGRFPLTPGMTLKDLLMRAGGLRQGADPSRGDFTRVAIRDGKKVNEQTVYDLNAALAEKRGKNPRRMPPPGARGPLPPSLEANPRLQPGDVLTARLIQDWRHENTVVLSGEFRYPGAYTFQPGERISDVVARAGGFSERAFLKGAVFKRKSVLAAQQSQLRKVIQTAQVEAQVNALRAAATLEGNKEETVNRAGMEQTQAKLLSQLAQYVPVGRVVVKLDGGPEFRGTKADLVLEPGDELLVPPAPSTVQVEGAVHNAVSLMCEPGKTIGQYLEMAGGRTRWADPQDLYVVRADGTTLSGGKRPGRCFQATKAEPGDTIWVPLNMRPLPPQKLKQMQSIVQIIGNLAVTALAIENASR